MQILDLEQNSPVWEEFRRTHIGASDSPTICGVNPYKSAYKLWKEKAVGEKQALNTAMKEGHRLEASARKLAQEHWDMEFSPLCVLHDSINYLMASLDGYNKDKGIGLEIKVVGDTTYEKVTKSGPLLPWIYQVNHQMECSDSDSTYIFVMHRERGIFSAHQVGKDKSIVKEILEKDADFYERLLNFEPPEDSHQERADNPWRIASEEFLKAKFEAQQAEEYLKTCRQLLIDISGNESCKGFGVSTTRYISRGSIDYSKIPELKAIDLNAFRKEPKESWRVS
jgi:putative phage-type endonuclease